ncbi:MAG: DMT family transporter [Anaerolineales bacterium]|nr:DMT family transporter [Anaerolineales bacterium]
MTGGEAAALITSLLWAMTSLFFTQATARVGPAIVNKTRLLLALILLACSHFVVFHTLIPIGAGWERWSWFALSGVIGLIIGDAFLFQAFDAIGPRLAMLLMSLAPVITTIFSWIFLSEQLSSLQLAGILITVAGIAFVAAERGAKLETTEEQSREGSTRIIPVRIKGILYGLGGATGQALGLVTSKIGLAGDFPALSGNLIRVLVAATFLWAWTIMRGQIPRTWSALRTDRSAIGYIAAGSVVGPFLGIWFSLIAIQNAEVGVASTLMGLAPIILLPLSRIFLHEKISWKAVLGTFVAVLGVAILFIA